MDILFLRTRSVYLVYDSRAQKILQIKLPEYKIQDFIENFKGSDTIGKSMRKNSKESMLYFMNKDTSIFCIPLLTAKERKKHKDFKQKILVKKQHGERFVDFQAYDENLLLTITDDGWLTINVIQHSKLTFRENISKSKNDFFGEFSLILTYFSLL